MRSRKILVIAALASLFIAACQKYTDTPGKDDIRLHNRFYCNTPTAVNYNWNFPGTADSTTCFFPSDVFKGHYYFVDSIYGNNDTSLIKQDTVLLDISAADRTHLTVSGFCSNASTIRLTASRTFIAQVDTTVMNGQTLCRSLDTLSGYIATSYNDTLHRLHFNFTVVSDTGTTQHRGTAVRQ